MKKVALIIMSVIITVVVQAQTTNYFEEVSAMWFAGQKIEVLNAANACLAVNSNDIAGLILKMEYEIEFLDFQNVTNTMQRVMDIGSLITTPNFVGAYTKMEEDILNLLQLLPHYPADEIDADRAKGNIPGKPFLYDEVLQALQDDGYFQ